ncbi:MAG: ferredoxin--NADP reductase [Sphingobacteriales bacterium]|nr:MAG: ferredoxin--NADP reductase [Sphingobacteriales bacterium]
MQVTILNIKQETHDVKTFTLANADGKAPQYEAGQFITLISAHTGIEERRSYSFSSTPINEEAATITVKRLDNGIMSRHLFDRVQVGNVLEALKPTGGFFTLPANTEDIQHYFFFAAGVGITPICSLIKTILLTGTQSITLVYSNRSIADTLFYTELESLRMQYEDRFHIEYLFSTASDLTRARLSKTLLPDILQELQHDGKTLYYLCGPFPYMRMVMLGLEEAGIPADSIRKENFNTSIITSIIKPPDEDAHQVNLHFNQKDYQFTTQYPDTILKSAKKNGIPLPYSCENGICGTCVAQCTGGHIWHRNNEVLTDEELQKGLVLTCVAYPVGGDVSIKLND